MDTDSLSSNMLSTIPTIKQAVQGKLDQNYHQYDTRPLFTKTSTTLILFQSTTGLASDAGFGQNLAASLA